MKRILLTAAVLLIVASAVLALAFPAIPTNVRMLSISSSSVTMAWNHDRLNTKWYEARLFIPNVTTKRCYVAVSAPLQCTFTGLTAGQTYKFHVAAVNRDEVTQQTVYAWSSPPVEILIPVPDVEQQ